eukprot:g26223.t1
MLPGMQQVSYEERLDTLGFFSLEQQRLKKDLIEVHEIMRGMDTVNRKQLFHLVKGNSIPGDHMLYSTKDTLNISELSESQKCYST